MEKVVLAEKFARIDAHWSPKIIGALNGQEIKIAVIQGAFVWHSHADADEMFMVVAGRMVMQLRDREVSLEPGELFIVPRGVEHRPYAEEEARILMFEPAGTLNTGDVLDERSVLQPEHL